jgi:hypothetical protein
MTTQQERLYREREYGEAYQEKIKVLRAKHPNHNYEILNQLAALMYPKLFAASMGDFEDDFDLKEYAEDEPHFDSPADELAHRSKVYSLENGVDYERASAIILDSDSALAENYKMS